MRSTLADAREYLERALSEARSRMDYHAIGERICELMEMQELEELRMLRTPVCVPDNAYPIHDDVPALAAAVGVASARHLRRLKHALRGKR